MMDLQQLRAHRRENLYRSVLLLAGMGLLLALIGWILAGAEGVVWTLIAGSLSLLIEPKISLALFQRLYGARRLTPYEAPGLYGLLRELCARAGLPRLPTLFYIPSPIPQAMAVGSHRDAAIGVTGGLLGLLPAEELAAVLAHEVAHVRSRDMRFMALADAATRLTHILSTVGLLLIAVYLPLALAEQARLPLLLILLLLLAPLASALLQLSLSRTREFDADAAAVELTGDPQALANALRRLEAAAGGFWEGLPGRRASPWTRLLRTHPTAEDRIARLERLAPRQLPISLEALLGLDLPGVALRRRAPLWEWFR